MGERLEQPAPAQIRQAREQAGLTQAEAAQLVSPSRAKPYRTWQNYEAATTSAEHRAIPPATWELFLLITGQHPELQLVRKA